MFVYMMLFCGDLFRKSQDDDDDEYMSLSVPVDGWLATLRTGGRTLKQTPPPPPAVAGTGTAVPSDEPSRLSRKRKRSGTQETMTASLSFIQVCRNYVRSYEATWESLANQDFLRYLYKSAVAFYLFPGCSVIDVVGSIRLGQHDEEDQADVYVPLLVSIKARTYLSEAAATELVRSMVERAEGANLGGALCLVLVFGSHSRQSEGDTTLPVNVGEDLWAKKIVSCVVRVPMDDDFGLSSVFADVCSASELSELLASHPFIRAHANDDDEDGVSLGSDSALCSICRASGPAMESRRMYNALRMQLRLMS